MVNVGSPTSQPLCGGKSRSVPDTHWGHIVLPIDCQQAWMALTLYCRGNNEIAQHQRPLIYNSTALPSLSGHWQGHRSRTNPADLGGHVSSTPCEWVSTGQWSSESQAGGGVEMMPRGCCHGQFCAPRPPVTHSGCQASFTPNSPPRKQAFPTPFKWLAESSPF